ncbi:MAG: GDP-mannose 4,6-dehydratase [Thermoplasmata archaeon]|nr:GDP-mannose 4,6-dehydratase [Thermoplasmata archaeon]
MSRILVTGATGFIGRNLCASLARDGHDVTGTYIRREELPEFDRSVPLQRVDVRNRARLETLVRKVRPQVIYHLAGQAYVIQSYRDPVETFETNVIGTIHLFEIVRQLPSIDSVVVACSGAAYGLPESSPIAEDCPLHPIHPYGVSKATQDTLSYQYALNFDLPIVRARLFGTTGPGKRGDAINDFAIKLRKLELQTKGPRKLLVGNLTTARDISDVRDTIRALRLLSERAENGQAINLGAGRAYRIQEMLDRLIRLYGIEVEVRQDPGLIRPTDEPLIVANVRRLRSLGFRPEYPMTRTLRDVVAYWRSSMASPN